MICWPTSESSRSWRTSRPGSTRTPAREARAAGASWGPETRLFRSAAGEDHGNSSDQLREGHQATLPCKGHQLHEEGVRPVQLRRRAIPRGCDSREGLGRRDAVRRPVATGPGGALPSLGRGGNEAVGTERWATVSNGIRIPREELVGTSPGTEQAEPVRHPPGARAALYRARQ